MPDMCIHTHPHTHVTLCWMCVSSNGKKHLQEVEESILSVSWVGACSILAEGTPAFTVIPRLEQNKEHLLSSTAEVGFWQGAGLKQSLRYWIMSLPTSWCRSRALTIKNHDANTEKKQPFLVNLTLKVSANTSAPLRLVWEEMPTKNSLPVKRMSLPSKVAPRKSASSASISTTVSFNSDITLFTASTCRNEERTLALNFIL